jgi:hypothetical protein
MDVKRRGKMEITKEKISKRLGEILIMIMGNN